jgi:hypothetical protein
MLIFTDEVEKKKISRFFDVFKIKFKKYLEDRKQKQKVQM